MTLQTHQLLLSLISIITLSTSLVSKTCLYTIEDSNGITSTYDLSQFYFSGNSIHEVDDESNTEFKYKFNICGTIPEPLFVSNTTIPSYCRGSDKGPCIDFIDYKNGTVKCKTIYPDTSTKVVPTAVQIVSTPTEPSCYWLGMELSADKVNITKFPNYKVEPLDADNSGAGIIFTMLNGQFCASGHNMNRQLSVSLICPDSTKTKWDADLAKVITEPVTESPICEYHIEFESPLACPQQCITELSTGSYAICSTHGICAADPNAGKSRCICDDGYGGDLCQKSESDVEILNVANDDLITAIIICTVFLALFCGIAVYLWFVWKRHMEMNRIFHQGTHEYFLNIDDEMEEEDDDTLHGGMTSHTSPNTKDTFHPVVSVDVGAAKLIQQEFEKQVSLEQEDNNKPSTKSDHDNENVPDEPPKDIQPEKNDQD